MIFRDQALQLSFRLLHLILRGRRVDHLRIQHLSRLVHHRQLAAGTECRIPAKHHAARDGRLHEKLLQILSEYGDRAVLRLLGQVIPDLPFNGRRDQTAVAVRDHLF